jgi:DNA-binding transcriptional ArsR family regulator
MAAVAHTVSRELDVGVERSWQFVPTINSVLTSSFVGETIPAMLDIAVIDDPAAAEVSLDPIRTRLLAELAQPGSASSLAVRIGIPRQKVNYHLHALERHGLVELVEERRKGNMTERVMRASAGSYLISPAALLAVAPDPDRSPDQRSARWLLALGGRLVQELGELITRARGAGRPLATFGIDTELTFASAADRAAFAAEASDALEALVAKYHDQAAPGGRRHRVILALHPSITRRGPEQEISKPPSGDQTTTKER